MNVSTEIFSEVETKQNHNKPERKAIKFSTPERQKIRYWEVGLFQPTIRSFDPLPRFTKLPCWWDRHTFKTQPVGCPINYHENKKEGIEATRVDEKFKEMNFVTGDNDFFETEGIFCSIPCINSHIIDEYQRTKNPKYKNALGLLSLLLKKLFPGIVLDEIPFAPSWKMINTYGGPLSIDAFRNINSNLEYQETVNIKRPYMFSTTFYIKEKRKNKTG